MNKQNVFSPLANPSYRTFLMAQLFSDLGNWLDLLAIGALITYTWQLGLEANAVMVIAMGAPFLFIGPVVSVWVDRLPSRSVMLFSTVFRLIVIVGFLLAENIYMLLPLIFLKSALASINEPARQSMLRHVVKQGEMAEASALGQMVSNGMKMTGPAVGGLMLSLTSVLIVFVVECLLFLVAILIMLGLPPVPPSAEVPVRNNNQHFLKEVGAGFRFLFHQPVMRSAVTIVGLSTFIMFLYDGFFAPLVRELGLGALGYGLITGSLGFGSIVGALIVGQFTRWRKHPVLFMAIGRILSGFLLVGVGCGVLYQFAHGNTLFWMIHFGMTGAVGVAMTVPYAYLLQTQTPKELIGRVSSVSMAVQGVAIFSAPALGAVLGRCLGLGMVFVIAGCLMGIVGMGSVLLTQRKKNLTQAARS